MERGRVRWLKPSGARVEPLPLSFTPVHGSEVILCISERCRTIVCKADTVNYLNGVGKGVRMLKVTGEDQLLGFKASTGDRDLLLVETNRGAKKTISTAKYRVTARGGIGHEIQKNGRIAKIVRDPVLSPGLPE